MSLPRTCPPRREAALHTKRKTCNTNHPRAPDVPVSRHSSLALVSAEIIFFHKIWARILERLVQMSEEIWRSIRALSEKRVQDRHYARFYERMIKNEEHPRKSASATAQPMDMTHDSWKERYTPDPWIDQMLLSGKVLSFKVPLSAELREALQLV